MRYTKKRSAGKRRKSSSKGKSKKYASFRIARGGLRL
jgi:hypothetical protein